MVEITKWEYYELWGLMNPNDNKDSYDLGREGWELVAVNWIDKNDNKLHDKFYKDEYENTIHIEQKVFKRRLPQLSDYEPELSDFEV